MKKLIIIFATLFIASTTFALKVKVVGAGGVKYTLDNGKHTAHICPQKADDHCATLEMTGSEIKILVGAAAPVEDGEDGGDSIDYSTMVFELVNCTPIDENTWEDVILIEK